MAHHPTLAAAAAILRLSSSGLQLEEHPRIAVSRTPIRFQIAPIIEAVIHAATSFDLGDKGLVCALLLLLAAYVILQIVVRVTPTDSLAMMSERRCPVRICKLDTARNPY